MLKINGTIFYLILAFIFITAPAAGGLHAAESGKGVPESSGNFIGAVDLAAVYALHPFMQYYDEKAGRFIKIAKARNVIEFFKEIQERDRAFENLKKSNAAALDSLQSELKSLEVELKNLENKCAFETALIYQKQRETLLKSPKASQTKEFFKKNSEEFSGIQEKLNKDRADIIGKIALNRKSCLKVSSFLMDAYYMTAEENAGMFKKINEEILATVNYVARKKGVSVVINLDAFGTERDIKNDRAAALENALSGKNDEIFFYDYKGINNAGIMALYNIKAAGDSEGRKKPDDRLYGISKIYNDKNHLPPQFTALKVTPAIVYGGTDITIPVCLYILLNHGISKEVAETVNDALKN